MVSGSRSAASPVTGSVVSTHPVAAPRGDEPFGLRSMSRASGSFTGS